MAGSPWRRTQANVVMRAQGAPLTGPLAPCACVHRKYRFGTRVGAELAARAYRGSVRVEPCPARGYHLAGTPDPFAMSNAGVPR